MIHYHHESDKTASFPEIKQNNTQMTVLINNNNYSEYLPLGYMPTRIDQLITISLKKLLNKKQIRTIRLHHALRPDWIGWPIHLHLKQKNKKYQIPTNI